MLVANPDGKTVIKSNPVNISSKFKGQQKFIDTTNGVYWESMPTITREIGWIQASVLDKRMRKGVTQNA